MLGTPAEPRLGDRRPAHAEVVEGLVRSRGRDSIRDGVRDSIRDGVRVSVGAGAGFRVRVRVRGAFSGRSTRTASKSCESLRRRGLAAVSRKSSTWQGLGW